MNIEPVGRISAADISIPDSPIRSSPEASQTAAPELPAAPVVALPAAQEQGEATASPGGAAVQSPVDRQIVAAEEADAALLLSPTDQPEGGKGGNGGELLPPSPASPPSAQPAPENAAPGLAVEMPDEDEVFSPAPSINHALSALEDSGLYLKAQAPGQHAVKCPWSHEHGGDERPALYFEPTPDRPYGGFTCPCAHDERPGISELLGQLGVDQAKARSKPRIRFVSGRMLRILDVAERALALTGDYYQSGGVIVSISQTVWGDPTSAVVSESALLKALARIAVWQKYDGRSKSWQACDPTPQLAKQLLNAQEYHHLPTLDAIARQPYFRKDGALVTQPGYDPIAKTFAAFDQSAFSVPEPTEANAREALAELRELLSEVSFPSEADRSAALCAMLTAAVRSSLPLAPAINISASTPGAGKSYISKLLALFAGPGEPLNLSYPTSSDEATKAMLAALLAKPAVICFDDMQTDWVPHGMINRMLTSETVADRILGSSRTVQVGTNALVMGTGNNIAPIRDMTRRVVTVTIRPLTANPAMAVYRGNPVGKVKAARERYVTLAQTIIRAWQAAGRPSSDVPPIATFGTWSDMCRQPLLWLGESDPATSLLDQVRHDPDAEPLSHLLEAWHNLFGMKPVTLRTLVDRAESQQRGDLLQAIMDLPVTERGNVNRSKLGWYLKRNAHRIVDGRHVEKADSSERNAWRVVATNPNASAKKEPEPEPDVSRAWTKPDAPYDPTQPVMINGEIY